MWLPEPLLLGVLHGGMHVIFDLVQFTNNTDCTHHSILPFTPLNLPIQSL